MANFHTIETGYFRADGGAMFGDFDQYLDQSFADSHLYGNIFTNGKDYGGQKKAPETSYKRDG